MESADPASPLKQEGPPPPSQPWGYPPPAWGAPQYPPAYYPPPYYPPMQPYLVPVYPYRPAASLVPLFAGLLWVAVLARDILFMIAWLELGPPSPFNSFGPASDLSWVVVFTAAGAAGAGLAAAVDFQRTNFHLGTLGAVVAIIGSSFPGIVFIGPVGLVLALVGVALHVVSHNHFRHDA